MNSVGRSYLLRNKQSALKDSIGTDVDSGVMKEWSTILSYAITLLSNCIDDNHKNSIFPKAQIRSFSSKKKTN